MFFSLKIIKEHNSWTEKKTFFWLGGYCASALWKNDISLTCLWKTFTDHIVTIYLKFTDLSVSVSSVLHHVPVTLGGITLLLLVSSSHADVSEAEDQNRRELNYRTEKLELQDECDGVERMLLAEGRRKEGSQRSHYLSQNRSVQRPVTLGLRPTGDDVTVPQPVTRGRTTLLLCFGAKHHKIINHHALILSPLLSFWSNLWLRWRTGNVWRDWSKTPASQARRFLGFFCFLKAQHRTEASSLTPVGQTPSLDVASLFLFPSLDILVRLLSESVVRNLHHPTPPLALNSQRGFLKKLRSYFKAHLILWSDATLSLIVC